MAAGKKACRARVCVEIDEKDIWLTAFTNIMHVLLQKSNVSSDASINQMKEAILQLQDINLQYDCTSSVILQILD